MSVLLNSCQPNVRRNRVLFDEHWTKADSSMHLSYAQGFRVDYVQDCKLVSVYSPWGKTTKRYCLYRQDKPQNLPTEIQAVKIPLQKLSISSCTHVGFLDALQQLSVVKGVCNLSMVYHSDIRRAAQENTVVDLGDNFSINAEKVLALGCDALIWSGYGQYDAKVAFLESAGLPIVENNEWMEPDLLGRAEWIKFMALFFDREALADSLFQATEAAYFHWKSIADTDNQTQPLAIVAGENFRGTWYMPGGRSYMAQLFRDAGASYYYENDSTTGSIPLNVERVLRDMSQADVWVGVDANSLRELAAKDERYQWFEAYQNKNVYAYNRRSTPQGGNDFWEAGVVHPDRLLSDFVKLLHPDLMQDVEWHYLKALQ